MDVSDMKGWALSWEMGMLVPTTGLENTSKPTEVTDGNRCLKPIEWTGQLPARGREKKWARRSVDGAQS